MKLAPLQHALERFRRGREGGIGAGGALGAAQAGIEVVIGVVQQLELAEILVVEDGGEELVEPLRGIAGTLGETEVGVSSAANMSRLRGGDELAALVERSGGVDGHLRRAAASVASFRISPELGDRRLQVGHAAARARPGARRPCRPAG